MSDVKFEFAIWHPFGPHGSETVEEIIKRKRQEIRKNREGGWTLWSFQHRRTTVLMEWSRALSRVKRRVVFCSDSPKAVDPSAKDEASRPTPCMSYRPPFSNEWRRIPAMVKVPHPLRVGRTRASAFVVSNIRYPLHLSELPAMCCFSKKRWRSKLTPRGEYLIRAGRTGRLRPVLALLELKHPFVVAISTERADSLNRQHRPATSREQRLRSRR